MVLDKTGEARLLLNKKAPASYHAGGRKYVVFLDREGPNGRFHFTGTRQGGTEKIEGWDKAHNFSAIE